MTLPPSDTSTARVLHALRILDGDGIPEIDPEEAILLQEFRELRESGFGRMEVIVVGHQMEGINPTRTKKRKDLGLPPKNA